MSKDRDTFSPQEEIILYAPWWAKVCQVLWKLIAVPAIAMLLGAVSSFLANWLLNTQGVSVPDNSLLKQWLTNWQIPLLIGICLSLCTFIIWWLSHWQARSILSSGEQNRNYMLKRLKRTYHDLFTNSLEGISWIELEFRRKSGLVLSDADRLLPFLPQQRKDPLPGTFIHQIYLDAPGGLLILGNSGAGKTILLLSLARWLIEQAQNDPMHSPLPMFLPLSSWAIKQPPLLDWCCEQIARLYNVEYQLCKQWIRQEQIILLLDGLDEMAEEDRSACIAAINTYHHEHLAPLIVCSRCAEYEQAAKHQPLTFQDAIIIQPLVYNRVVEYLATLGKEFDALRSALGKNAALRELVATPLMLSILMRTYRGVSVWGLSKKEAALRDQVWEQYIERKVQQEGNKKGYSLQRYLSWLHWLASQMRAHNQTVFSPECLQPDWLPKKVQRVYTWLAVQVPSALIGGLAGLLTAPLLITLDRVLLLQYSLLSIFLGIMFSTLRGSGSVHTAPKEFWGTRRQLLGRLALSGWLGCMWSIVSLLNKSAGEVPFAGVPQELSLAIPGIMIGLSCFWLMILFPHLATRQTDMATRNMSPNWRLRLQHAGVRRGRYALLVTIIFGLGIGLSAGIEQGISYGLSYGFLCIPLSFILATPGRDVYLAERLGWTWRSLLRSLSASKNLRSPLAVIGLSLLLFGCSQGVGTGANQGWDQGLSWGLSQGLSWGLIWGLSCWFLLGLFQSISHEFIGEHARYSFNRGIHHSFRNSLFMSLASAVVIGMVSVLSWGISYELSYAFHYGLGWGFNYELGYALNYGLHVGLSQGLSYAWLFALSGGLLAGVLSGELVVLRHYILRFLLWQTGLFPWNIQTFLVDATSRALLLSLEGGYTFAHRQLLDYLADYGADKDAHEGGEKES